MDLLKILDAKPDIPVIDSSQFNINPEYQNSNDYKIATPLADFQKELIDQIVSLHYSDILKFFERVKDGETVKKSIFYDRKNEDTDQDAQELEAKMSDTTVLNKEQVIIDSLDTLLMNTQLVCNHPYLLIDHYFPKSLTTKQIPERLAETSGKFEVFAKILQLLDKIYNAPEKADKKNTHNNNNNNSSSTSNTSEPVYEPRPIDIIIVARPDKTIDLIDAICLGHKVNLKRYSGSKVKEVTNSNKVKWYNVTLHLFPSDFQNLNEQMLEELPDKDSIKFLISFDISCDTEHQMINSKLKNPNTKIIRLVPISTIEHIVLYYRNLVSSRNYSEYLKPVTSALVILRDRAGQLPSELRPIYEQDLTYLSKWLNEPETTSWPLPDLSSIPNFTPKDVEKSLLTEVKFNFNSVNDENTHYEIDFNSNGKTKMIGHIFQPFHNKVNKSTKQDYYDYKRLEKRYLSNPMITSDYEQISGVLSTFDNDSISPNDNSRAYFGNNNGAISSVMTHKIMYEFAKEFGKLIQHNEELKSFDEFNEIRLKNLKVMQEAYTSIFNELKETETQIKNGSEQIVQQKDELDKLRQLKRELEERINSMNEEDNKWIKNELKIIELRDTIVKLKAKKESMVNETEYMKTEIERAERSTNDSIQEISKLKEETINLTNERKAMNYNSITNDTNNDVSTMRELLKRLKIKNEDLESQLKEANRKLSESNSRSRYVNYSRNGYNSFKKNGSPSIR